MVRTNQGGSILSFVIIGAVLAALLVGGAYFVNRQTQLPRDTSSAPTNAPAPTSKENEKSAPADDSSSSDSSSKTDTATSDDTTTTPSSTETSDQLPQTGPAQTLSGAIALGALGYVATAYIRSRRATTLTSLL